MCTEYNGWVNWETWNMNLWLGESGYDEDICRQAEVELADFTDDDEVDTNGATSSLAEWLSGYAQAVFFDHLAKDDLHGPAGDAIYASYLPKVEWRDIAKHYITEAANEA